MEKVCEWCQKPLVKSDPRARFCNRSCSAYWRMSQPGHRETMRKKVWDNPEWREQSRQSLATLKSRPEYQEAFQKFLHRSDHPFLDPKVRAKALASNRAKGWPGMHGGNGTGPTRHEVVVSAVLGWPYHVRVTVGDGEHPHHYELDVAEVDLKVGVEIDGRSHECRKDQRLSKIGWTVIRFSNQEIDEDLAQCLARVAEVVSSI